MSLFRRLMVVLGAGGAGYQSEHRRDASIFSTYSLCSSIPFREITVNLASAVVLSIAEVKITATGLTSIHTLSISDLKMSASQLASTYSLETNPT